MNRQSNLVIYIEIALDEFGYFSLFLHFCICVCVSVVGWVIEYVCAYVFLLVFVYIYVLFVAFVLDAFVLLLFCLCFS